MRIRATAAAIASAMPTMTTIPMKTPPAPMIVMRRGYPTCSDHATREGEDRERADHEPRCVIADDDARTRSHVSSMLADHSTVTLFARLRGWSTSQPRSLATW